MGRGCYFSWCINHRSPVNCTVHRFPKSDPEKPEKRRRWEEFAVSYGQQESRMGGSRQINNIDNYGVCSLHFRTDDYCDGDAKRLKPDAIPSVVTETHSSSSETSSHKCPATDFTEKCELTSKLVRAELLVEAKDKEIRLLQRTVADLQDQLSQSQKKENDVSNRLQGVLSRFTAGQRKMLLNPSLEYVKWSQADIAHAIPLYNVSAKAYNLVRDHYIPLPTDRTMRTYLAKMPLEPNQQIMPVFNLLNERFIECQYHSLQTACVVSVDELGIDSRFCYDETLDQVFGGEKNATVFTGRGLFLNWKQPLQYSFQTTSHDLLKLITLLYENGLNVVGCVSDLGPKNRGMWKDLGVGKVDRGHVTSTSFKHPITGQDILWMPDFPHLLKRFRDAVLDSKITFPDGTILDRSWFEELINIQQPHELRLTHNLGLKNLNLRGQERQNCRTAFQMFSNKVAKCVRVLMKHRPGFETVASFVEMMNNLSDLFNTRLAVDNPNVYQAPYGLHEKEQNDLLKSATCTFMEMRVGSRKNGYAPFQKGIIMLIQSTQALHGYLDTMAGYEYLQLRRLNQDYLENLFSIIRSYGGFNANPNAVELKYRLRKALTSWTLKETENFSVDFNVLQKEKRSNMVENVFIDKPIPDTELEDDIQNRLLYIDLDVDVEKDYSYEAMNKEGIITEGSMEYVAGFIAHKLAHAHPELSNINPDDKPREFWVHTLSNGGLTVPSTSWLAYFMKFEEYFKEIYPMNGICKEPGVVMKLRKLLSGKYPQVPESVIKYYSKCRIMIRIKYLNKRKEDEKYWRSNQRHLGSTSDEENDEQPLSESGERLNEQLEQLFKL